MKPKRSRTIYQRKSAFEKRENTLGKAYAKRNKRGKFIDSRFNRKGLDDDNHQVELDRSEVKSESVHVLTHRGVPIKDLRRNTPLFLDDEPDVVEADVVHDLHFGGGLLSAQSGKPMSFRDKMHDLIQRSKEKKAGHQLHQEEVHDNVMKADENWQNVMDKIVTEFDKQPGSKLKQRIQQHAFNHNRKAIMEMNTVVNFLQSSGVSSSGGNPIASEKDSMTARGMNRLSEYLDTKTSDSDSDGPNDSAAQEEEEENQASVSEGRKCQPFLEVIHCMDVLVNMDGEKRLQAISALCQNLQKPVQRFSRLVGGLLISNVLSKATTLKGNSSPELHHFLINALSLAMAVSRRPEDLFMPLSSSPSFIEISEKVLPTFVSDEEGSTTALKAFMEKTSTDSHDLLRLHCLVLLISLVEREALASQKRGMTAPEVLIPLLNRLKRLPRKNYPSSLKEKCNEIIRLMEETITSEKVRAPIQWTEPTHKEIEMIEPIFGDELSSKKRVSKLGKRMPLTKEEKTRRLKKKVKDERKSAMRELRRDTEFLQSVKRKEQMERDDDRKKKVARIMGDLATQEGDFRRLTKRH